jgi:hypothetical protein
VVVTASKMVGNAIFINLKIPTQLAKIAKEENEHWVKDTLSKLNLRN